MDSLTHSHVPLSDDNLIQAVHDSYSAIAKSGTDTSYANRVAHAFGYTTEQLQSIPAESHMGLSCGNPIAAASIKEGENVLDLGSGGGIDVLLAAARTGPGGKVVGLDMSSNMISLARRNALKKGLKPPQVAFVQAALTDPLPITSDSIDCILSNCVINLLPFSGKANLIKEIHRVLKPGGRIVIDDILAKKPLPEDIRSNLAAYVGCISGAIETEVYKNFLINAGFQDIVFIETRGDINVYYNNDSTFPGCCTPKFDIKATQSSGGCCGASISTPVSPLKDFDANSWVASYQIYVVKNSTATVDPKTVSEPLLRWWDAYPAPTSSPALMSVDELSSILRDPSRRDEYAVIDVRGNDCVGGHVRGSFQYPAQAFYDSLAQFAERFRDMKEVVFYCSSSKGRGPRCAGWCLDYLNQVSKSSPKVYVLQGGIALWLSKFGNEKELVDYE